MLRHYNVLSTIEVKCLIPCFKSLPSSGESFGTLNLFGTENQSNLYTHNIILHQEYITLWLNQTTMGRQFSVVNITGRYEEDIFITYDPERSGQLPRKLNESNRWMSKKEFFT